MGIFDKFEGVMRPPKTPELDRMHAVVRDSNMIGEFIDWLQQSEKYEDVADLNPAKVLSEYFNIDPEKIETERREVLAYQRLFNEWDKIRKELLLKDEEDEDDDE